MDSYHKHGSLALRARVLFISCLQYNLHYGVIQIKGPANSPFEKKIQDIEKKIELNILESCVIGENNTIVIMCILIT